MNEQYPKFSKEHIIIRELIKKSGKLLLNGSKINQVFGKKTMEQMCQRPT